MGVYKGEVTTAQDIRTGIYTAMAVITKDGVHISNDLERPVGTDGQEVTGKMQKRLDAWLVEHTI